MADRTTDPTPEGADSADARVAELKERIEALSQVGDDELGSFTRLDWIFSILLGALVPLLALYWGAP